ncbi:FtsX-like permease family protein [uncultured Clostridium sp.]|uniref:ABC transporter permease n=1 Tax=uncultured Clostridium sp. TaxID=59620 RepID=UPI003216B30A
MISSYKTLSWRYLKDNKKRTILTIIGIILSVALITSICTFILTVQNSMLENTKKTIGAFHVAITNVSKDEINKIETNPKVNSIGAMVSEDAVPFIKNKSIQLNYLNEAAFKLMNVNLEEGQLPKNDNEIVIERWILRYFNEEIKVGDVVKIQDETGNERNYILSGIVKDDWKNQSEGTSKAYLIKNSSVAKEDSTVLVEINEKADKQEVISEISNLVSGKSKVDQNKELLRLTGESRNEELNRSIYSVVFIVIGIVVLATVVVIYNAFHISIAERMKQFGLLRAIGTTKKQIMTLVIREAFIMILIGIPLGLFFGIVSVYCIVFTFSKISGFGDFSNLKVVISPLALLISGGVGAVTIYFSAYLPARSAGKISPLIAISSQSLIKKEKKNKSGKFLGRFLKIDTAIALKNVKRNKRRFYVTVLSMAISVTLFVTFTSFAKFSDNFAEKVTEDNDMAFSIFQNYNTDEPQDIDGKIIEEVKSIPGIDEIYINYKYILTEGFVDNSAIPEEVRQWASENDSEDLFNSKVDGENKSKFRVVFQAYEDNKLEAAKKYIKEGSIDNLKDGEVIIVRETIFFGEKRSLIAPMAKLKVGDEVLISNAEYSDGQKEFNSKDLKKVKVAAIVDVQPFYSFDYQGTLNVIGSKETVKNIIEGNPQQMENFKIDGIGIKISGESYVDKIDESLKKIENTNAGLNYHNKIEAAKSDKAFKLQISILLMGFTIVIALISAVNIVNTVTTNILLRSKEIAALKAIGMTRKQVKKMITFEGVLFGLYGGVIGSILGTILSYVLYNPMSNIRDFKFILPWESIIIAIIAVIIMGYISALIPLRRLSKENIIDGIRGE